MLHSYGFGTGKWFILLSLLASKTAYSYAHQYPYSFPEMFEGPFSQSIIRRATKAERVTIELINIRDYSTSKHKNVDDYPFGGGSGMVMGIEPIFRAIEHLKTVRAYDEIIYTSPDGQRLCQPMANRLSTLNNLLILCGHYKGIDQRVRDHLITMEVSIGDYVLTGGELAAAVITDSVVRLIPGVLSDETSALSDSFQDNLLAPPVYTRPFDFRGWTVPDVLMSGHQKNIDEWRHAQSVERTRRLRPDLLA